MVNHYPNLVEAAIEFRLYSRKVLAERSEPPSTYIPLPEHETVDFPQSHYRLEKDESTGYIYCCRKDQTLHQRVQQKRSQPRSPFHKDVDAAFESPRDYQP